MQQILRSSFAVLADDWWPDRVFYGWKTNVSIESIYGCLASLPLSLLLTASRPGAAETRTRRLDDRRSW